MTRTLDGGRDAALILGAKATASAGKNLPTIADESLKGLHILVIDGEGRVVDASTAAILKTHVLNPLLWTWWLELAQSRRNVMEAALGCKS